MDSNYKIKYNKYKEKYLNLKKLIGSGLNASAKSSFDKVNNNGIIKSIIPQDANIILSDDNNDKIIASYKWGISLHLVLMD
jgi:hypothetical protein